MLHNILVTLCTCKVKQVVQIKERKFARTRTHRRWNTIIRWSLFLYKQKLLSVTFLLRDLDQTFHLKAVLYFERDCTKSKRGRWKVSILQSFEHVYIQSCTEMLFIRSKFRVLFCCFASSSLSKILIVLKRVNSYFVTQKVCPVIEIIHQKYDAYRTKSTRPWRFWASPFEDSCIFSFADLVYSTTIDKHAILQTVIQDKKLNFAAIPWEELLKDVWG